MCRYSSRRKVALFRLRSAPPNHTHSGVKGGWPQAELAEGNISDFDDEAPKASLVGRYLAWCLSIAYTFEFTVRML